MATFAGTCYVTIYDTTPNGIKEGVSRFHQMVCVFRSPDNSNIILICSCLYVS